MWFETITAVVAGGYSVYIFMKLRELENIIAKFPTPEEIAREVIKVKIPMSEIPQDIKNQIKEQVFGSEMPSGFVAPPPNKRPKDPLPSYLG